MAILGMLIGLVALIMAGLYFIMGVMGKDSSKSLGILSLLASVVACESKARRSYHRHLSIQLSICQPIYQYMRCLSDYPSIYLFINLYSVYPTINLSAYLSIYTLSIQLSIYLPIYQSILCLSNYPSICLFINLQPASLTIYPILNLFVFPIYLTIYISIY